MHQFDYLCIFVSIIIALGVSHLITSGAGLILLRDKLRPHWPTLLWMVILFLIQVEIWWRSYSRRDVDDWTFAGFLLYLMMPILASLMGYLLIPAPQAGVDLEAEYYRNRRWFFGLLVSLAAVSLLEELGRSQVPHLDANLALRFCAAAVAVGGLAVGGRRAQIPLAVVFLTVMLAHMALGFWRLS